MLILVREKTYAKVFMEEVFRNLFLRLPTIIVKIPLVFAIMKMMLLPKTLQSLKRFCHEKS